MVNALQVLNYLTLLSLALPPNTSYFFKVINEISSFSIISSNFLLNGLFKNSLTNTEY